MSVIQARWLVPVIPVSENWFVRRHATPTELSAATAGMFFAGHVITPIILFNRRSTSRAFLGVRGHPLLCRSFAGSLFVDKRVLLGASTTFMPRGVVNETRACCTRVALYDGVLGTIDGFLPTPALRIFAPSKIWRRSQEFVCLVVINMYLYITSQACVKSAQSAFID